MSELMAHVIDDDDGARESLAFLLSSAGIPAQTYASAEAFLAVASGAKGVVVTDLQMPEMNGLELIHRLKARGGVGAIATAQPPPAILQPRRASGRATLLEMRF
jgi:FixJ family two-component response regulator